MKRGVDGESKTKNARLINEDPMTIERLFNSKPTDPKKEGLRKKALKPKNEKKKRPKREKRSLKVKSTAQYDVVSVLMSASSGMTFGQL